MNSQGEDKMEIEPVNKVLVGLTKDGELDVIQTNEPEEGMFRIKKMKTKKPVLMNQGHSDEMQTPKCAINPLLPFLKKSWIIWECAWGKGSLAKHLEEKGFKVIGEKDFDFLKERVADRFDCIITNPPYSLKDKFIEACYQYNKPFALLMPLTTLEGKKRGGLFRENGIQLIIPNKRINFITPSGKGSGAWFQTAWFCWKLNLPNQLNFVELKNE